MYTIDSTCLWSSQEGIRYPGAGVTGGSAPPDMGDIYHNWVQENEKLDSILNNITAAHILNNKESRK